MAVVPPVLAAADLRPVAGVHRADPVGSGEAQRWSVGGEGRSFPRGRHRHSTPPPDGGPTVSPRLLALSVRACPRARRSPTPVSSGSRGTSSGGGCGGNGFLGYHGIMRPNQLIPPPELAPPGISGLSSEDRMRLWARMVDEGDGFLLSGFRDRCGSDAAARQASSPSEWCGRMIGSSSNCWQGRSSIWQTQRWSSAGTVTRSTFNASSAP